MKKGNLTIIMNKKKLLNIIAIIALFILLLIFLDWTLEHAIDGWQNPR
jgi:hypothetical protein